MSKKLVIICFFLVIFGYNGRSQMAEPISVFFIKKTPKSLPGKIINIPFFIKNNTAGSIQIIAEISTPNNWNIITNLKPYEILPSEQKFSVISVKIPSTCPVGNYSISITVLNTETKEVEAKGKTEIEVMEIENISMQLIESPEHIVAGNIFKATFMLQNFGNTTKKVFIETSNCDIEGNADVKLEPGESTQITIFKQTSPELISVKKEYFTVRALLSNTIVESIFRSIIIFPVKSTKKDLFFRFPVEASATYLSTNQGNKYQSAYQFEISGNGTLDPDGKHQLEFLARGSSSVNLNFLGLYDQYYISYLHKNIEVSVGEKSYSFTPLTESSRFGMGVENKVILNNGLAFGFLYVKPRFYKDISNEFAFYSQFEKNRDNIFGVYYVLKKNRDIEDLTYLTSINTKFAPFNRTNVEMEVSRGKSQGITDNAFRTNINTQLWIFHAAGNYFYTGKNYPGYYNNSTFYSGVFSAQVTPKLNIGVNSRQDFKNAQLDTFFITAPFSKSIQTYLNYNIASRSYLKLYWREYERKDRLALDKFHYKTKSINTQFSQKFNKIDYSLRGEYGKTTNLLLDEVKNQQNTYRGSANFAYRFNSLNAIRIFGSWSNINNFVSGEQRNLTAGLSISSQISKNLKANFHIQNAYDIDDYYRNRNLMQLNINYRFLKKHMFSFRSYYTIFKQEIDNPEFFLSATYTYNFGIPVKQIMKAGDIKGRITNNNDAPQEGILVNVLNKKTITDKNGEFWFKSIQPGKILLSVDRSKFEIDELPSIPIPIEIEVIEDKESIINFKIIKGTRLHGKFSFQKSNSFNQDNSENQLSNIIIELKSDFKNYLITSNKDGGFSFPIVLPGQWVFKIYDNSLPSGFEIEKKLYNLILSPSEKVDLQIEVKRKKRNIIFKTQNISLTTSKNGVSKTEPLKTNASAVASPVKTTDTIFYSIQVGAFKSKVKPNSGYFKKGVIDFERKDDKYYKYFVGKYNSYDEAFLNIEKTQNKYKGAFIVIFRNNKLIYLNNK